jgi:hypothetical protein
VLRIAESKAVCKLLALVVAGLGAISLPSSPLAGQTSRSASSGTATLKAGTLVSVDTAAAVLTLKPRSGPNVPYRYTEKTRLTRGKKTVEIGAFSPGDEVIVRFRRSSVGPASLYDLADKPSWEWLNRVRHEITPVTVKEIADDLLRTTEGPDAAEVDYRVTDNTLWAKDGHPVAPVDFVAGDIVYIVPRLLPGGSVLAVGVSDTKEMAARLKERSRFTVTGTLKTVNLATRAVSLHTLAGDSRDITLLPDCVVRRAAKDVAFGALKAGQTVTVHLTRNDEGEKVGKQITIQTKRPAKKPPKKKPQDSRLSFSPNSFQYS